MGFGVVLCISNVKSDTVRLIDAKQNMVGVVSKSEAIRLVDEDELDLVILSTEADLPVLKIMDYKYVFCLCIIASPAKSLSTPTRTIFDKQQVHCSRKAEVISEL
ncbi:hypothetical protein ACFX19_020093 [Malus domestica]